jgi:hypothetical protein
MCLRRAPEKYIAGAASDRAGLDNMGSLASHNHIGLHGLLRGWLYFFFFTMYDIIFPFNLGLNLRSNCWCSGRVSSQGNSCASLRWEPPTCCEHRKLTKATCGWFPRKASTSVSLRANATWAWSTDSSKIRFHEHADALIKYLIQSVQRWAKGWTTGDWQVKEIFLLSSIQTGYLATQPPTKWVAHALFTRGYSGQTVKPTIQLRLIQRLRMAGL